METMERYHDDLQSLGLEIDYFGETTWVIKSVPAVISVLDPISMLHDILDMLYESKGSRKQVVAGVIDDLLASMACKAAIKAGNVLSPQEMISLLQQMEESDVFSHCPHGRPVVKTFLQPEVEKWFHRHGG
jgi:DNA mismatch repair protein MutL